MPIKYELLWYMVNLELPDVVNFNVAIRGVKFGDDDVRPQGIDMSAPTVDVGDGSGSFGPNDIVEWVRDNRNQVITKSPRRGPPTGTPTGPPT